MAARLEIYKCDICGSIIEVLHGGEGELVCCGEPMALLGEHTTDEGKEKHVPELEKTKGRVRVQVGSVPHPMEEKHFIEWIEIVADGKAYRQFLEPGRDPVAIFDVETKSITAREHCNVHGLWKAEQ